MRHNFLIGIFLLCSIFCSATKVALLDPITGEDSNVTSFEKSLLRGELRKAIYRIEGWEAVSRSDIDQVLNELDFQHTGYVPRNEVHRLGQISGADYLCVSSLNKSDSQFYLEAYLVEVSTGNIESPVSQLGEVKNGNMVNLYDVCQMLVRDLIGTKVVTGGEPIEETFDNSKWGWTVFSHDSKSVQIANDELRITNYASTGTTQSDVMVPVDINKNFEISFQFLIQEAKMFSSVGIKFGGNKSFVVNVGTCSFVSGMEVKTSGAAKMGLGRNRPVLIKMIKNGESITLQMNGKDVFEEECPLTTNQMSVFAGINTLAMLRRVSIQYTK
jgi:hypothetical protein